MRNWDHLQCQDLDKWMRKESKCSWCPHSWSDDEEQVEKENEDDTLVQPTGHSRGRQQENEHRNVRTTSNEKRRQTHWSFKEEEEEKRTKKQTKNEINTSSKCVQEDPKTIIRRRRRRRRSKSHPDRIVDCLWEREREKVMYTNRNWEIKDEINYSRRQRTTSERFKRNCFQQRGPLKRKLWQVFVEFDALLFVKLENGWALLVPLRSARPEGNDVSLFISKIDWTHVDSVEICWHLSFPLNSDPQEIFSVSKEFHPVDHVEEFDIALDLFSLCHWTKFWLIYCPMDVYFHRHLTSAVSMGSDLNTEKKRWRTMMKRKK